MKVGNNMKFRLVFLKKRITSGGYKTIIPSVYLLFLIAGLFLSLLYMFIPALEACPTVFAQKICAPAGIYIALLASLPGYILVGNIMNFLVDAAWGISLIIVIAASIGFYFLLGLLLDTYKKSDRERKTKLIVWSVFALILIIFLILLFRTSR